MILRTLTALLAILVISTGFADAKPRKHRVHRTVAMVSANIIECNQQGCTDSRSAPAVQSIHTGFSDLGNATAAVVGGRPAGCPWRYCGCGVSLKVFGKIIPELNLAANWKRKFPRTSPASGMVAARSGHVFYIMSVIDSSTVVAYDPNSGGGRTRIHTVSLRGYTVVNPHGSFAKL